MLDFLKMFTYEKIKLLILVEDFSDEEILKMDG
jgi:hypothetical protein